MTRPNGRNGRKSYAECAEMGLTQAATARFLGVSPVAVCNAAKRLGLVFRSHSRPRADYLACAAAGMTPAETAAEMGVNLSAVYGAARRGVARFRPEPPRKAQKYHECAARGLTMSETARELGVTRQTVAGLAAYHGITFRRADAKKTTDLLTPEQAADYEFLTKRNRYSRAEALNAIGRADLTEQKGTEPCVHS